MFFYIFLPALIRILNYQPNRIHGDDLISAYFSANYNIGTTNFFAPVPLDKAQWVCQFPSLYFFLQKLFFLIFGHTVLSVKLSIIPYVLIVSLMLYLIVKKIFNKKTAIVSLIIYSFFAVSLYHETLGLHFISSTAVFMLFFYFLLRLEDNKNKRINAALTGSFCGCCYLFYSSSYLALFVMSIFFIIKFLIDRRLDVILQSLISFLGFFIVIIPFLIFSLTNKNFYFNQRFNQVSLLNGQWSSVPQRMKNGESKVLILKENLIISFQSLTKKDIGGHGGYNFGHQALFDTSGLILFILGSLSCLNILMKNKKKRLVLIMISLVIFFSFFLGMVLTIPPPAYHRFSLAFPFLVIIMSAPFYIIDNLKIFNNKNKNLILILILIFFCISNEQYFLSSVKTENNNEMLQITDYLNLYSKGRSIYIAAFPGFAFEKIFFFKDKGYHNKIITDYHNNLLKNFNPNEKYIYVIIFPKDFNSQFLEKDKQGHIFNILQNFSIFYN